MSKVHTTTNSEDVIKELKNLVIEVNYSENVKAKRSKLDKTNIWEKAKKVGKHLSDDSLPVPTLTRP
jgi:hypothetical protein